MLIENKKPEGCFDLQIEQVVLGLMMYNNSNCDIAGEILQAEYFYIPLHQRLYSKIMEMRDKEIPADSTTLTPFIKQDVAFSNNLKKKEDVNMYLMRLVRKSLDSFNFNFKQTAIKIKQAYLMRQVEQCCIDTIDGLRKEDDYSKVDVHLECLEEKIFQIRKCDSPRVKRFKEVAIPVVEDIHKISEGKKGYTGIPTGLTDLDNLLNGFHKSDLIILAGSPSMGKTALAITIANNIAEWVKYTDQSVLFVSLETSAENLVSRLISIDSGINAYYIKRGMISSYQLSLIDRIIKKIISLPLIIDDPAGTTITSLKSRLRILKRKENMRCVFIDYLQLLRSEKMLDRYQLTLDITRQLKEIAKELDITIIVLSQLSRAVETREDKIPQLYDLTEYGTIVQHADVVMLIYRESYYEERKKPKEGDNVKFELWRKKMEKFMNVADVIVAKNRNGPVGSRKLFFDRSTTSFRNFKKT